MKALVAGAKPGDCFFFHYSGHGNQAKDSVMLENDGMNEVFIIFHIV